MLNKKRFFWLLIFPLFALLFGCANRQPPAGGPRDHDPPKLLKATPANMTRFFKGKTIRLDFDEYFKLTNAYSEISISPTPTKIPEYKKVQKSIVITLRDSLEKNTTYVINFGKAIADVDEGNVLKNFTYVFSTGAHIDSLSISGRVTNTLTGERDKDAVVMLFTLKQDSLLFGKKKPTIYASVDSAGNFALNNLHPDDYRLYALKQSVANKIYDPNKDLIAFNTKTIRLTGDTSNVELKLFKENPTNFRLLNTKNFDADGKISLRFNRPLDDPSVRITYPPDFDKYKIVQFSKTKDSATVFLRNMDFDSIRMELFDKDKPIDTMALRKGKKEAFTRTQSFSYNLSQDAKLKPGRSLTVTAVYPIADLEPTAISLKEDSTDVSNFNVVRDTANPRKFTIDYRWKQKISYNLTISTDAVTDIYGGKNKGVRKSFLVDNPENYSLLTLTVTVPDTAKSYIVELLNEKQQVLHSDIIHKNTSLIYKDYITGKYNVRVTYDDNKNGKWDSGNVKLRRQPENIWLDPEVIALRPNWEQITPITIPKEPATL